MGGIGSRIMDFVCKPNFIFILQYWARSRRLHRVDGSIQLDDDEEYYKNTRQRYTSVPNTDRLDKHEINFTTKQACELTNKSSKQNLSITSMIQKRTIGPAFNTVDKCWINNNYLPNRFDVINQYNSKIFCGSHSKDGRLFLTASQDRLLRVFHTYDDRFFLCKIIPAQDVGWSILDTAFSPDGSTIVYSSWSECLYQCSVLGDNNTHEMLSLNPNIRRFCVFSVVFSNDGREILGGANDGYLYTYDRECHKRVLRIAGHDADINAVTFADQTSQIFYSAGDDGLCKVWDKRMVSETDPRPVGVLAGHMDGITYIDSRGDSRYLITNSKDQTIKLWDVRALSGKTGQTNTREAVSNQNWDYRWQSAPKRLYRPGNLLEGDTSIMTYRGHCVLKTLIRCRFSPAATTGQRYIYTGCSSGRIFIYDLLTGKIVRILFGHGTCVRDVSWHPFHPHLISTSWDCMIAKWQYRYNDRYTNDDNLPGTVRRSERIYTQQAGPRFLT
ncbi:DDB1- and CUL4-associated factor 11-like isoform X3 [Odontomachus brunneus]|uniref:DDB1- and CUL4-associated factor 11-like isoform X3 n=1 Tax=Odontomachus brunneus TaxID=486640 RepID=UPI0013F269DC|nr:DDB1- and CUL4-associated factor 11-like isoform X3 [Odontomachus brunneus]